jgi:16S rRNA processing protein RimM
VLVGRVVGAHGVRGELAVASLSDVPDRHAEGAELWLVPAAGVPRRVRVDGRRDHRGLLLLKLSGVEDRDAAEALRGATLEVDAEAVPAPPEDAWYHFQLVGCHCRDRRLGDLGEVVDVVEDGGGVLLAVRAGERELLLPFVEPLVAEVDLGARLISCDLPEGLVEACTSG